MKFAILDFDHTMYDGYARYELAREMEKAGLLTPGISKEIDELQQRYENGEISYNQKFSEDKPIFAKYYEGLKITEINSFMRDRFNLEQGVFPWVRDAIELFHQHEYLVVVISGTWDFIMEEVSLTLPIDTYIASTFEMKEGVFTGNFTLIVDEKVKNRYAKQLLISATDSIGIGDSQADFEFLDLVKKPFLFEPKADATLMAESKGIKSVDRESIMDSLREAVL